MNLEENIYATPQAPSITSNEDQVNESSYYVDGKRLVVRDGARLPNICIHTGVDMNEKKRQKRDLYWASPWWAALLVIPIIYLIVYFFVNKKFTIHYSVSTKAVVRRNIIKFLLLLFVILGISGIIYALSLGMSDAKSLALISIIIATMSSIAISKLSTPFHPKKHQDGWLTVAGVSKEFLRKISEGQ